MVSRKDPAFLFYPADWLTDSNVAAMTLEQRGAYLQLLCIAWLEGGVPSDPQRLRALLGLPARRFGVVWGGIADRWVESPDGRLVNRRQEAERVKRQERAEELRSLGRRGGLRSAQARGRPNGQADASPNGQPHAGEAEVEPDAVNPFTSTSKMDGLMDGTSPVSQNRSTVPEITSGLARAKAVRP